MIVELWTRKREMGDEDGNNMEDMGEHDKSGVGLAWMGLEDLALVIFPSISVLVPAVARMANWLAHEILISPSFSWSFPPSPPISLFLVLKITIT